MTTPIILVKIYYKLTYVIQGVKNIFDKVTSWPQLISKFLPVCNATSDWPRTFLYPKCFCLAYHTTFCKCIATLWTLLKLALFKLSLQSDTSI